VALDVANGKVSREAAAADYGVVVTSDGTVDPDDTKRLRAQRRNGGT
jgi:hypothetical protein